MERIQFMKSPHDEGGCRFGWHPKTLSFFITAALVLSIMSSLDCKFLVRSPSLIVGFQTKSAELNPRRRSLLSSSRVHHFPGGGPGIYPPKLLRGQRRLFALELRGTEREMSILRGSQGIGNFFVRWRRS